MDYSFLLPAVLAAVASLAVVVLAYAFQLRALQRQQEFERKRLAYEKAANSLRKIKSLAALGLAFLKVQHLVGAEFDKAVKATPEEEGHLKARKDLVLMLVQEFFLVVGGVPGTLKPKTQKLPSGTELGDLYEVFTVGKELLRAALRSHEDFEESLVSLRLIGDRMDFAGSLEALRDKILEAFSKALTALNQDGAPDWQWFDSEFEDLTTEMRADLTKTLSIFG